MKAFFLLSLIFIGFTGFSQNEITWDFSYNSDSRRLEMKADLAPGWHVYSTDLGGIAGPIPTEFEFEKNNDIVLIGQVEEPEPKVEFDPNFEETVKYFDKEVIFTQQVNVKSKKAIVKGSVVYMVCNDTMCLPPVEKQFEISLKK